MWHTFYLSRLRGEGEEAPCHVQKPFPAAGGAQEGKTARPDR